MRYKFLSFNSVVTPQQFRKTKNRPIFQKKLLSSFCCTYLSWICSPAIRSALQRSDLPPFRRDLLSGDSICRYFVEIYSPAIRSAAILSRSTIQRSDLRRIIPVAQISPAITLANSDAVGFQACSSAWLLGFFALLLTRKNVFFFYFYVRKKMFQPFHILYFAASLVRCCWKL